MNIELSQIIIFHLLKFDHALATNGSSKIFPMTPHQAKEPFALKLKRHLDPHWPGWSTILIWTGSIMMLTGFTVRDLLPLLDEYKNNNRATQIAIVKNESNIRPPNISVCMPYYSNDLATIASDLFIGIAGKCDYCQAMEKHGWNIWRNMTFDDCAQAKNPTICID